MTTTLGNLISEYWGKVQTLMMRTGSQEGLTATLEMEDKMRAECEDLAQRAYDMAYGQGHREGRDIGQQEGWAKRDHQAQLELARKDGTITGLQTMLDVERQRLAELRGEADTVIVPSQDASEDKSTLARSLRKNGPMLLENWTDDVTH